MAEAKRTTEDIQREIAEVELQTKQFNLAQAKRTNEEFVARDQQRRKANAQRMTELKQGREGRAQLVRLCRHKSGGTPDNILKGGGIGSFSVITRALMPDGVTIFLQCLRCPLNTFCKSRGAEQPRRQAARKRTAISYALARRDSSVLLVQRPANASLMAGMWELPALAPGVTNGDAPLLQVRHSITDTDYRVAVFTASPDQLHDFATNGQWFTHRQCERLPLTGLTRKVLRRLSLASKDSAGESICH